MTPGGRRDARRQAPPRRGAASRSTGQVAGRADSRARLRELIEPLARTAGFDLEQVTVSRAGRRHLVRVVIDSDAGVGLDAIAEVSRSVSAALDAAEEAGPALLPGEYLLEVSSPGVDRPLTTSAHWRRNVGRLVAVSVSQGEVVRQVTGRIMAADAGGATLEVSGASHRFEWSALGPGRIQVEFQHAQDGGDEPDADEHDADEHDADEYDADEYDAEKLEGEET